MTAAVLHAQELVHALVELVVADSGDVELQRVHCLDRRLVMKQGGHERARADQIPAPTVMVFEFSSRSCLMCVARYSIPPAGTVWAAQPV